MDGLIRKNILAKVAKKNNLPECKVEKIFSDLLKNIKKTYYATEGRDFCLILPYVGKIYRKNKTNGNKKN